MASLFTLSGKPRLIVFTIAWLGAALAISLILEPEPPEPTNSSRHGNNTWALPPPQDYDSMEKAWKSTRALGIFYKEDAAAGV